MPLQFFLYQKEKKEDIAIRMENHQRGRVLWAANWEIADISSLSLSFHSFICGLEP
jgi:hypothetical protein